MATRHNVVAINFSTTYVILAPLAPCPLPSPTSFNVATVRVTLARPQAHKQRRRQRRAYVNACKYKHNIKIGKDLFFSHRRHHHRRRRCHRVTRVIFILPIMPIISLSLSFRPIHLHPSGLCSVHTAYTAYPAMRYVDDVCYIAKQPMAYIFYYGFSSIASWRSSYPTLVSLGPASSLSVSLNQLTSVSCGVGVTSCRRHCHYF